MATYRSTVNAVIVKTVALAEVSAAKPCKTQKTSPKMYGYLNQMAYISGGSPEINNSKSEIANEKR